jgi:SH3-like domain-containing protein
LVQRWQVDTELSEENQSEEDTEEDENSEDEDFEGYEVIKKTKLYAEADTKSDVIAELTEGDMVVFSEEFDDKWSYVWFGNDEGYVLNSCVDWESEGSEEDSEEESNDDEYEWYKVIKKTKMYSEADVESEVVAELSPGVMLAYSEEIDDEWSYMWVDDFEGYVLNSCVDWEG